MPRVSAAFFPVGALCVGIGMLWGMRMGSSQDFTLAPAHAHLNLLGWVTMGLYGTFYALTKDTMSLRLAWTNFVFATVGILVMVPCLAMLLANGNDPKYEPGIIAGSVLTFIALLIFLVSVFRELVRKRA